MTSETPSTLSIGEIIRSANQLSSDQVERILDYQKQNNLKFGEAAVALGFVQRADVLWALSQQFEYPYANSTIGPELQAALQPFSPQAEAIRSLRSQLLGSALGTPKSTAPLAIVSPCAGDGKSYICANLAVSLAQMGSKVVIVDADMRTPRQHKIFNAAENATGLSSVLANRGSISLSRPIESIPNLYLLPVGITPPNPLELIQRQSFIELLNALVDKFDHVLVDTPAAQHGADARAIAQICRHVLLVGRRNHTSSRAMDKFAKDIKDSVHHVSMVMNDHA
jgi:protein-tyrosine kinase